MLGMTVSRTHYHLQRLLEQNLVRVVGRGRKRWKEEVYYSPTARHFLVHPRVGCGDADVATALERSVQAAFLDWRRREILGVDLSQVARHVVLEALQVKAGEHVLLLFGPPSQELGEALLVELDALGARTAVRLWSRNLVLRTLDRHTPESLASLSFIPQELDAKLDAVIFLSSNVPEGAPPNEEQRSKLPHLLETVSRWNLSIRRRGIRYLEVALPHRGELEGGTVTPEEAIDLFWRSLTSNPEVIRSRGRAVLAGLRPGRALSITGRGTELTLVVDPESAHLSDGVISKDDLKAGRTFETLPAGALAFLPDPARVNGVFAADYTFTGGRHYRRVRVRLRKGRIVEIQARSGTAELRNSLDAAAGDADLVAEFGIGLNEAGSGLTGKPVLDACLSGSVTLSFGNNELLGGNVRSTLNLVMPATGLTITADGTDLVDRGRLVMSEEAESA
jgi:leucyl aminopeptidase (aminopeptidase T)